MAHQSKWTRNEKTKVGDDDLVKYVYQYMNIITLTVATAIQLNYQIVTFNMFGSGSSFNCSDDSIFWFVYYSYYELRHNGD